MISLTVMIALSVSRPWQLLAGGLQRPAAVVAGADTDAAQRGVPRVRRAHGGRAVPP